MLGLIGGLGVGATIYYYEQLAKAFAAAKRPLPMLMAHADVDLVRDHVSAGDLEWLAEYFRDLIARLAAGGATFAAIPAVTPHVCMPLLAPRSPLPLVNVVEETARDIRNRGLRRVALFGTRWVVESHLFGMLPDVETVLPRPDEIETIHDTYFGLVYAGGGAGDSRATLIDIAQTVRARDNVEAIVLAGTEFSLVFGDGAPFPVVDCTRLHIEAILANLLAIRK